MHFIPFLFLIYNLLSFHLAASAASWWRWRKPKLRFVRCFAAFAFICPFCCRKRWTVRFRLPKKRTQTEKSVQVRFGGDGGNRSCASSAASQPSHLYVPFAVAKDGLCGFDYLKNEPKPKNRFRFVLVEMAETEAALRPQLRSLRIYMSLLLSQKMDCAVSIT